MMLQITKHVHNNTWYKTDSQVKDNNLNSNAASIVTTASPILLTTKSLNISVVIFNASQMVTTVMLFTGQFCKSMKQSHNFVYFLYKTIVFSFLAVCFNDQNQTYHHLFVFANLLSLNISFSALVFQEFQCNSPHLFYANLSIYFDFCLKWIFWLVFEFIILMVIISQLVCFHHWSLEKTIHQSVLYYPILPPWSLAA